MLRKNIWNNDVIKPSNQSNTSNNKFFRFIIKGNTDTNHKLLTLKSNHPINIQIKGHSKINDIYSSHYSNNFITSDIEYVTIYKKDDEFNLIGDYNNCIIQFEKANTDFYYCIEMFSESDITYTSDYTIILI